VISPSLSVLSSRFPTLLPPSSSSQLFDGPTAVLGHVVRGKELYLFANRRFEDTIMTLDEVGVGVVGSSSSSSSSSRRRRRRSVGGSSS